ncbi:MAG: signal recognition particle protein, partial [Hornefia butyriciproducens]|nr:signal recognition particle protein [Hornefia butyriciproducens]
EAEKKGYNVLIIDTAGRLQIDEELMQELQNIKEKVKPHQILLVVDALTGQDAVNAAKGFNEKLDVDGIIMTKMDGDARGGAALSARKVTGKPILFLGTGEKYNALEAFHPDRMASRILGMGDLLSLIENAERDYDEAKAEKQLERLKKNQFTLEDFLEQMGEVKRMGGIGKILEMMPGVSSKQMQNVNLDESEKEFRQYEAIIYSMTKEERQDPSILNASRRKRIAAGCGLPVSRINTLIKRYEETKKMLKQFSRPGAMKKNRMLRGLF